MSNQLEPLDLNPWRVLVVAAHPGDIELGAAGIVASWTKKGAEVIYLLATRGELSMPGVEPEAAALIRSGEQSGAAAVVGVQVVDFLDLDDGTIEPSVRLRRAIVRDIRRFRPDVVLCMNHREFELDGTFNDADHRAVGIATLDAVAAASNQWMFRDTGESHSVDEVLIAQSPSSTHFIDVTGFEDSASSAFAAHKEHLASISGHPTAQPGWLLEQLKSLGSQLPVERVAFGQSNTCHTSIVKDFVDTDGAFRTMKLKRNTDDDNTTGRARNSTKPDSRSRRESKEQKPEVVKPAPTSNNAMKLKLALEKRGRSIGIEIPDNVTSRLGDSKRPEVTVEINDLTFETPIGTAGGVPFVAINADRRKIAGIEVGDEFFVALAPKQDETAVQTKDETEPVEAPAVVDDESPRRNRRRRPSRSRKHK